MDSQKTGTFTTRDFMSRITLVTGVVTVVTIAAVCAYLLALLKLPDHQWRGFGQIVALLGIGLFAGSLVVNQALYRPIVGWLKSEESGTATPEQVRSAFQRLSILPAGLFMTGIAWWSGGGLLAATLMKLRFESFSWFTFTVVALAAASAGFASSIFTYYGIKRAFLDLHSDLAGRIANPDERRDLVRLVPLRLKLVVSVTGVTFGIVVYAMFLQAVRAGEPLERNASLVQDRYLAEVVATLERDGAEALPGIAERARRLAIADDVVILDAESGEVLAGPVDGLHPSETVVVLTTPEGRSTNIDSPHVFAWRAIGGGETVAVALLDWAPLGAGLRGVGVFTAVLLAVSAFLCYALSRAVAADVGVATEELREAAIRLASGDLRPGRLLETEDEVGELARAFERMALALRTTVSRVSDMTDRIESTAGDMASVSRSVSRGALEQGRGVQTASESVDRMNGEMSGIAGAAEELSLLVEEAGGTVLEIGTAGEHLDETATVLSERVDEVSSSIEQMVRSVKEVGSQTVSLSEVASQTSESMEIMVIAMRRADDTAEESASLSRRVVETADRGRARVQQTIESMESIRLATEAAERVIFGLGARTKEIGAILDVIDDVADETNLLALNAAIIAAQAGEQGRAFSVVAEQIKELADRVLASTKEIGSLIRTVQGESHAAVGAIEQGSRSVATGVSLSTEAGASLEEITRASRESGERIEQIAHAVREQTKAAAHVAEMMERVKSGVDTIQRASAEQDRGNEVVYRSVLGMRDVAQQLRVTTREQSRGASRLRVSTEGVRSAVESIHTALQSQSGSCSAVATFLEEVSALTRASERDSERLGSATTALLQEAEALRADVQQFGL